ncbi:hypothetical protein J7337_007349 [Fusarium musae]|uniref:Uncharacterized protein n=1 Tax=Fusarium musae TaxID=1042133 RepID=A0A9P8DGY0_9HYPO|nr:hypothetical protein J7337_007349 [Fusarium musae]KAG9501658.1 hypothetical protein J7337_007349 [Fusarium musae]
MTQVLTNDSTRLAEVSYFEPLAIHAREKPYISNVPFVETDGPWNNLNQVKYETPITDIRGRENEFSLAKNGFEYIQKKFTDPPVGHIDSLDHPYVLLDMERFLGQRYGASMVLVYDAIVRKVGLDGYFQQADAAHIGKMTRSIPSF